MLAGSAVAWWWTLQPCSRGAWGHAMLTLEDLAADHVCHACLPLHCIIVLVSLAATEQFWCYAAVKRIPTDFHAESR